MKHRPTPLLATMVITCALVFSGAAMAQASGDTHSKMAGHHGGAMADKHGKSGMKGGMKGDMHGGMKGGKHGMKQMEPHNAAVHFLMMAEKLDLNADQIAHLQALRDAFITDHAVHGAQLKAAKSDLKRLLHADTIDMAQVEATLATIGKVEGPMWHAFAKQLAEIKSMLTVGQRQVLKGMHKGKH